MNNESIGLGGLYSAERLLYGAECGGSERHTSIRRNVGVCVLLNRIPPWRGRGLVEHRSAADAAIAIEDLRAK